jgi:hypothetical protein
MGGVVWLRYLLAAPGEVQAHRVAYTKIEVFEPTTAFYYPSTVTPHHVPDLLIHPCDSMILPQRGKHII